MPLRHTETEEKLWQKNITIQIFTCYMFNSEYYCCFYHNTISMSQRLYKY